MNPFSDKELEQFDAAIVRRMMGQDYWERHGRFEQGDQVDKKANTCPPCTHDCNQGRSCSAGDLRPSDWDRNEHGLPERGSDRRYALSKADQLDLSRQNHVRFHGAMAPSKYVRTAKPARKSLLSRILDLLMGARK